MRGRWDWNLLGGWILALVVLRAARMTERDPYWQARDGIERSAGTPMSRPDSWSWAQPGGLFRPTSPLWNSALGLGHQGLGVAGIALVGAAGMLAYFGVAVVVARRLGARPLPTLAATVFTAILALPMVSPRATIVVQALLLVSLALGHTLVTRTLPRAWWTVVGAALVAAALGWFGAWLHVSWSVTSLGVAAALPLLALLSGVDRWRVGLAAAAGMALAAGSTLGPYGLSVWQLLLDVSSASDGQIVEWLSPFTAGLRLRWLPIALIVLALGAVTAQWLFRHRSGAPGSLERGCWALEVILVGISLAAASAGMVAIRFLGVAALTLLPVLAARLSAATIRWRASPRRSPFVRTRLTADYWRPIMVGALVVLMPLALVQAIDPGQPQEEEIARSLPRGCRLFADPDTAGAVLLLRPDVKVWVDMRTEVYGSAAYAEARRRLLATDGVVVPEGATCALVSPSAPSVTADGAGGNAWMKVSTTAGLSLWVPA
ncbi:hypothetical protein JNB_18828 [Janibacter sp. HTCC2649]|uniref:hypothetical protein n=1 Tax=Janibacter sp. HTCC2649 TaxID=313589 RepID=UPI0000670F70|nr:hypothetical protein [Janibacter sp. HTCC2649]EAP97554.1 hypothetical protein JNB_18828 [Janibacter sp. HTCC2649]